MNLYTANMFLCIIILILVLALVAQARTLRKERELLGILADEITSRNQIARVELEDLTEP